MIKSQDLSNLWQRGTKFLNCKYAIMGGAMSWISEHNLVSAISNAGAFGVIACSAMTPDQLEREINLTKLKLGDKSFGVNLILMHPQLDKLIEVCIKNQVTHIILAGGLASGSIIKKIKDSGAKAMTFAPSLSVAKKMQRLGADALIIEGSEAGGHIGRVSTSVLAQEILPEILDIPVFVAGGIGTGVAIANYLKMGASGCQLGTMFVCAKESIAHQNFKKKFIGASCHDTVVSVQLDKEFSVIPVRGIKNRATREFAQFQMSVIKKYKSGDITKEQGQLLIEKFWAGSLKSAVIDGDIEGGSVMAGEVVGLVKQELFASQIIDNMVDSASFYLSGLN